MAEAREVIAARAPGRLDFAGGGTDPAPYCEEYGGAVVNAAIRLYSHVLVRPRPDQRVILRSLDFRAENRKLNAYYAEFENVEASQVRRHEHAGVEFLYVVSGKLALRVGEDEHVLAEGDAIYFDSAVPHGYRKVGTRRTTALVVVTG